LKFLRIDGNVHPKDRDLKVQKFEQAGSRYFCLCMTAQVGGVGLTVTSANRVILVDPAWNPAADSQAIARVHRIGQQQEVVVYRLIGAGAIEDKMFRLQVFKRGLAKTAFEQEQQVRFFTSKDLKNLFQAPGQSCSTQSLMAQQLGTEALEHKDLVKVVTADVGGPDDQRASAFWQSSDVAGFSDYERIFAYLESVSDAEDLDEGRNAAEKARVCAEMLRSEEYVKDQIVERKFLRQAALRDVKAVAEEPAELAVLQNG